MQSFDVDARFQKLERENRRLRALVATAVVLAAAPFVAGYVPANDRIEASEFVVRDKAGVVRARLFVDDESTTQLLLVDGDSKSRAMLASGKGGSLVLADKDGAPLISLSASAPKSHDSAATAPSAGPNKPAPLPTDPLDNRF